jgi:hypothetical protein
VIVPDATYERLNALAAQCVREGKAANASVQALTAAEITPATLGEFIRAAEALPAEAIPAACQADLLALARALEQ